MSVLMSDEPEPANRLHPDDVRNWCHWVTCAECKAIYVCENKRCTR